MSQQQPNGGTDLSIPAAILGAVVLVGMLLWYSAAVPGSGEKFMPIIMSILFPLIAALIAIWKQLKDAQATRIETKAKVEQAIVTAEESKALAVETKAAVAEVHTLTNSNFTTMKADLKETATRAAVLALESAAQQIESARASGHASGLAAGRAEAVTALSASGAIAPSSGITGPVMGATPIPIPLPVNVVEKEGTP